MNSRLSIAAGSALLSLAILFAPRAETCVPGCSGYHLAFTGPGGPDGSGLATADRSVEVTWQDAIDGNGATFDLLASPDAVPAFPMHAFPAQLPGEVLALGLSATARTSWTWDTSRVAAGTYFLYAVFHNSPFNTLVMPFAVVAVAHDATTAVSTPAVFVRSPRGASSASGSVSVAFDAATGSASAGSVDVYVGAPPDASNPVLVAQGLSAAAAQTIDWDSRGAASGEYVFKAVVRDANGNALATAFSPGTIEVGPAPAPSGCSTGSGVLAPLSLVLLLWLSRTGRAARATANR
jgi:hypothetical protein